MRRTAPKQTPQLGGSAIDSASKPDACSVFGKSCVLVAFSRLTQCVLLCFFQRPAFAIATESANCLTVD